MTNPNYQLRRVLKKRDKGKADNLAYSPALMGDGDGTVVDADLENHVYVRIHGEGVRSVFNNRVPPVNDLRVFVGSTYEQPGLLQVLGTRTTTPAGSGGGAGVNFAPASRYQWMAADGGEDPLFVELRQFLPLRVGMTNPASMNVQVYRGIVWTGTAYVVVELENVSLTSYRPSTTGNAAYVLITIDDTGDIVCTKGTETTLADLDNTDIPAEPEGTVKTLAAVRVYEGQTAIQEARTNTDIVDLRFAEEGSGSAALTDHDHSGDAGDGGQFPLVNLLSTGATDGQVATANGSGGIAWETPTGGTALGWFDVTDYGATGDGSTDDTGAIQDALDAAGTAGGGVVYFPPGTYRVNGALQDTGRGNAQLLLPSVNGATTAQYSIKLLGAVPPPQSPSIVGAAADPVGASIIKGTLNSGTGALLGGWGPVGSALDWNWLTVYIENMVFEMPDNPTLTALDLSHTVSAGLHDVFVYTGNLSLGSITEPTTASSYGVILPANNNSAWTEADGLTVMGFYNGVQWNEHANGDQVQVWGCKYALVFPAAYHASYIKRTLLVFNANNLTFTGAHYTEIEQMDIEHHNPAIDGAKWYDTTYDVNDASNYAVGSVVYHVVKSYVGVDTTFAKNGGTGLHCSQLGTSASGVTSIATGTGLTGGPITSTGTISLDAALNDLNDVNTTGTAAGDVIYNTGSGWEDYPLGLGTKVTSSSNKIKFGNVSGGNYLEIDTTTGNLRLAGNATAFDDLRIAGSSVRLGATAPTLGTFGPSGNLKALHFDAAQDDEIFFEIQMPHAWKEGSRIYPHVHWTPVSATAGNVVWTLEYSWASITGTFAAPSTLYSDATAAGGTAWVHKLSTLKDGIGNAYIDGTGQTLSSMLVCRLHRNAGAGSDTLAADVAFLEFDIHYEVDSFGSDAEYQKDTQTIRLLEDGTTRLMEDSTSRLQE